MVYVNIICVTTFLESLMPVPTHKNDFDFECSETEMTHN
jgi:hypothetical protein